MRSEIRKPCGINAPGKQAAVFIDPLQRLPFIKSNNINSTKLFVSVSHITSLGRKDL